MRTRVLYGLGFVCGRVVALLTWPGTSVHLVWLRRQVAVTAAEVARLDARVAHWRIMNLHGPLSPN